jgi:hypothetical protein
MFPQMPPAWQIALSMLLMVVFIWAAIWFASRIYRVGILMYGKRATLPESPALDAVEVARYRIAKSAISVTGEVHSRA